MSWLTDLAGKAEDLLNNIDQGAATAIQKTKESGSSRKGTPSKHHHHQTTPPSGPSQSHHDYSVPAFTGYKQSSGYASSVSSSIMRANQERLVEKPKTDEEEERLIEFLNDEKKSASLSRRSSSSSLRSQPTFGVVADPPVVVPAPMVVGVEREVVELRAARADQMKAIQSKDGQLAVLRVRLQEADAMLQTAQRRVDKLTRENERLLKDSADSNEVRNRALDSVSQQMRDAEATLEREKQNAKRIEAEYQSRIQKLQDQVSTLSQGVTGAQKNLTDEKLRSKDAVDQLRLAKYNLEANKMEFDEYKQKAQKILQMKEKLIETLKEGGGGADGGLAGDESIAVELEEIRSERDLLKEDVQQFQLQIYNLKSEIQDMETQLTQEQRSSLEQQRSLQEQCQSFQENASQYREQLEQLKMEYQYIQDELRRQQAALHAKLQEKDAEIVRLMNQSAARSMTTTSAGDLEQRIRHLTENLIEKQTTIESLQTDKNAIALQLERIQRMYREAESAAMRGAATAINIGGGGEPGMRAGVPNFFRETPFDTGMTKGVKRAYGTLDTLSVKAGLFLRRYPMARVAVFVYMVILHFWVMVVLLTYSPEMHGNDYMPPSAKNAN